MNDDIYKMYIELCNKYGLKDTEVLWDIIKPICKHEEFIKRCNKPYYHHDLKTLGEHLISDAIVTYQIAHQLNNKDKFNIDIETAVIIAMFHDFYELPWQNNKSKRKFGTNHGFVHPIEAVVNSITYFPKYFTDKDKSLIIIDGIIHHMFPFPVRCMNEGTILNNKDKYDKLPEKYKNIIDLSLSSARIGALSVRKSLYIEGRIVSRADKKVAITKELKNKNSIIALTTGHNKNIK